MRLKIFLVTSVVCLLNYSLYADGTLNDLGFDTGGISTAVVASEPLEQNQLKKPKSTNSSEQHVQQILSSGRQPQFVMGAYDMNGMGGYGGTQSIYNNGTIGYSNTEYMSEDGYSPYNGYYPAYGSSYFPMAGPDPVADYETEPAYYQTPYYRNMMR